MEKWHKVSNRYIYIVGQVESDFVPISSFSPQPRDKMFSCNAATCHMFAHSLNNNPSHQHLLQQRKQLAIFLLQSQSAEGLP